MSGRGAFGHASRAVVVLLLGAGAAIILRLTVAEQLSETRLVNAIAGAAAQVMSFAHPVLRSQGLLALLVFVAGALVGWVAARLWTSRQSRRLPLIIADLRHANLPFADGVAHVRRYATAPVPDDSAAIWLILQQANRGRLTMWRRAAANTLWRVSSRQVNALTARVSSTPLDTPLGEPWSGLLLLAPELERLWPSQGRLGGAWKTGADQH